MDYSATLISALDRKVPHGQKSFLTYMYCYYISCISFLG